MIQCNIPYNMQPYINDYQDHNPQYNSQDFNIIQYKATPAYNTMQNAIQHAKLHKLLART